MMKTGKFMERLAELFDGEFSAGYGVRPIWNRGESWDRFINFTDGTIDHPAYIFPSNGRIEFTGFNREQTARAMEVQDIFDDMEGMSCSVEDYWESTVKGSPSDIWGSREAFGEWFGSYEYDEALDGIYGEAEEYSYGHESPVFVGVAMRLYDADNPRSDGVQVCVLESYFNTDIDYNRSRFRKVIYSDEFEWDSLDDLESKLMRRLPMAYASVGGGYTRTEAKAVAGF